MRIISVVSSSYNVAYSVKIGVDCSLQYGSGVNIVNTEIQFNYYTRLRVYSFDGLLFF